MNHSEEPPTVNIRCGTHELPAYCAAQLIHPDTYGELMVVVSLIARLRFCEEIMKNTTTYFTVTSLI